MYFLYSLTLVLTYATHYTTLRDIEVIFNDCVTILRTMNHLKIHRKHPSWRIHLLLLLNFVVNPLLQFGSIFMRMAYLDAKSNNHLLLIAIIAWPNFMLSLVPTWFFILMIGVHNVLQSLNTELRTVMMATAHLDTASPFRIQQRLCELSDRLDAIAQVRLHVTQVAQRICNLVTVNLVIWIMLKACIALLMCCMCYMYCMGWAFIVGFDFPVQILVSGMTSIVLILGELAMLFKICCMTSNEVYEFQSYIKFFFYKI